MKLVFFLFILGIVVLTGCLSAPTGCSEDARICPDGKTVVSRVGDNCEFEKCPAVSQEHCVYNDTSVKFINRDINECSSIRFKCSEGYRPFSNECGCGCRPSTPDELDMIKHYCTQQQRKAKVCIQVQDRVCGWFDPEKTQCVKYPCSQTFNNLCIACQNEAVSFWTKGECIA